MNLDRRSEVVARSNEGPVRGDHLNGTIPLLGLLIDFWTDGTACMAENERHESEDDNAIATQLDSPGTLVTKMDAHLEAVGDVPDRVSDGRWLGQHDDPKTRRGMCPQR